jgi:adenylate cyclase
MKRILTSKWTQIILMVGLVFFLTSTSFVNFNIKDRLRFIAFDGFNKLHPRERTDDIIIVDIDEETLRHLGQWPMPRNVLADLVTNMNNFGAKATVFDMVFAEEDRSSPHLIGQNLDIQNTQNLPNYDQIFANAIKDSGNVVTGFVTAREHETRRKPYAKSPVRIKRNDKNILLDKTLSLRGVSTNIPQLPRAAAGNGIFLATPSSDGIIRQIPLLVNFQNAIYPSLSLEGLRVAHNRKEFLKILPSKTRQGGYSIKIGESGYNVPIEKNGMLLVKYRTMDKGKDYLSMYKILDPTYASEARAKLNGRIAFIGTSAEGLKDIRSTPLNIFIPVVEIHANVTEQILQNDFLHRFDDIANQVEALVILCVGLLLAILSITTGALPLTLLTIISITGIMGGAYYAYIEHSLLLDPITPSLAILSIFIATTLLNYIRSESMAKEIRGAFGLYISPDFMEELTDNPDKLKLGGEMRELSVLFTDIRNFTTISESMTPEELINTMNDFLTPMSDEVMNHRGTIDKYMGDAMMAFWNAPLDDADHAKHAVQAALKMKSSLIPVNKALAEKAKKEGREPLILAAGMGINTGLCSVGNMGSKQRFAYSALGDAVNLASRLEGQTKSYGLELLVGEETVTQIPKFAHVEIDKIQVKGKTKPVRIFTVLGDEDIGRKTSFRKFKITHRRFIRDYRAQRFEDASVKLQDLMINKYATDLKTYYTIMMDRMEDFQKNTPPHDWDGVYVATSK